MSVPKTHQYDTRRKTVCGRDIKHSPLIAYEILDTTCINCLRIMNKSAIIKKKNYMEKSKGWLKDEIETYNRIQSLRKK